MYQEFFESFFLIFVAEMGDKSQILAMAFATRYPVRKVLLGMLIGAFMNEGLAVLLGSLVPAFLPMNIIQITAGIAFVIFALWSLKLEDNGEEEEHKMKLGPVLTVSLAYFIGEFGDKTQLTTITLASQAIYPLVILVGAVLGMLSTGVIGIFIGKKLGDKIPETTIRLVSSAAFLYFGITKLIQSLPQQFLTYPNIMMFSVLLFLITIQLVKPMIKASKSGRESALVRRSRELHEYYQRIGQDFDSICLGSEKCGYCRGNRCIIGYTKTLIKYGLDKRSADHLVNVHFNVHSRNKPFNRQQAGESLLLTLKILRDFPAGKDLEPIHEIRKNLEMILFRKSIDQIIDWDEYTSNLFQIDETIAAALLLDFKRL